MREECRPGLGLSLQEIDPVWCGVVRSAFQLNAGDCRCLTLTNSLKIIKGWLGIRAKYEMINAEVRSIFPQVAACLVSE